MKKIYLIAMAGILMLSAKVSNAQSTDCPNALAKAYPIGSECWVFAQDLTPDVDVALFDAALNYIGGGHTGFDGFVKIKYSCNRSPARIVSLGSDDCYTQVLQQAPLPVKLSSFNAQLNQDGSVGLKWVSSLELTSYKYVVQKSNDGLNFSDIGDVPAAGNSLNPIGYAFGDGNFISGASYYRLKQVDIDGKVEYSKIVYVNNKSTGNAISRVVPNPFTSDVQLIGINASEFNSGNVQVFNSFGQRVRYRINGSNSIEIDPSSARGMYILKVKGQIFKLVKN